MGNFDFEKEYLKRLYLSGYRYITKDSNGCMYAFYKRPECSIYNQETEDFKIIWYSNGKYDLKDMTKDCIIMPSNIVLLPLLDWRNKEPTQIEDLLKVM